MDAIIQNEDPRNAGSLKPSSFHEIDQKIQVPEVSLMFDNAVNVNLQSNIEKSTNTLSKKVPDIQNIPPKCDYLYNSPEVFLQRHLEQTRSPLTPNKSKVKPSTPNKSKKIDNKRLSEDDNTRSYQDPMEIRTRQTPPIIQNQERYINEENHLIEPVESYSVWKYKNQHMFVNDNEVKDKLLPANQNELRDQQFQPEYRHINEHYFTNKSSFRHEVEREKNIYKGPYEIQHSRDLNLKYKTDEIKNKFNKCAQSGNDSPDKDEIQIDKEYTPGYYDGNSQEYSSNKRFVHQNMTHNRNVSPLIQEKIERIPKYTENTIYPTQEKIDRNFSYPQHNENMSHPNYKYKDNSDELCKIIQFQNKHIEFLNEQMYTLTLQNRDINNVNKQIKNLQDNQMEQFEFFKKYFEKYNETLDKINQKLDYNFQNIKTLENTQNTRQSNREEYKNTAEYFEKIENKLVDLINSKINKDILNQSGQRNICESHLNKKNSSPLFEDDNQEIVSNSKNIIHTKSMKRENGVNHCSTMASKSTISQQCNCDCEKSKDTDRPILKEELKTKSSPNVQRNPIENQHYEGGGVQNMGNPSNQNTSHKNKINVSTKKSMKKIHKKRDSERHFPSNPQLVCKPSSNGQPILFYHQQSYQPERYNQPNDRNTRRKQKTDRSVASANDENRRLHKINKHYSNVKTGGSYRPESTSANDEHSLTLNARELAVINEHIPSPEASVHIDMGEYQSSSCAEDSESESRDDSEDLNEQDCQSGGGPWPTFYNNVVGKVHKMLQEEDFNDENEDDNYRTVQVRMATIDQFKKMGISFVDDSPNSKRVTFNKKAMIPPNYETCNIENGKRAPLTTVCNTNLSFASLQYMQRYHLLPPNIQPKELFREKHNEED